MLRFNLKNIFRAAAFSALTLVGVMAPCAASAQNADTGEGPRKTQSQKKIAQISRDSALLADLIIAAAEDDLEVLEEENKDFRQKFTAAEKRQADGLKKGFNKTAYQAWLSQLDSAKNLPLAAKVKIVNDHVNDNVTYMSDRKQYRSYDYWASAMETALSKAGDCEDFAILKFYELKYLGVPESRLCVMAVSTRPDEMVDHAVVAVDTSADNSWTNCLVMDKRESLTREQQLRTSVEAGYSFFYAPSSEEQPACTEIKSLLPSVQKQLSTMTYTEMKRLDY